MRISSSLFWPSRSKTLRDGLRASHVNSFSWDFAGASSLGGRPEAVLFWGWHVPALSCFLLLDVAKRADSACHMENCYEFVRRVEVTLLCVVAFVTCYLTHFASAVARPPMVGGANGAAIFSRSCLMVFTGRFVSSTTSSSWAYRLTTWARLTSVGPAVVYFLGLWGG